MSGEGCHRQRESEGRSLRREPSGLLTAQLGSSVLGAVGAGRGDTAREGEEKGVDLGLCLTSKDSGGWGARVHAVKYASRGNGPF